MSIFSQYVKQAKTSAVRTPLVETEDAALESVTAVEVPEEDVPEDAPAPGDAVVVDQFAQAREKLNQTHHSLIRGRSQIAAEDTPEVTEEPEVSDEVVEAPVEDVPENGDLPEEPALDVTAEDEPVIEDEPIVTDEPVVEEPIVTDEPVVDEPVVDGEGEAPVEDVVIDEDDAEVEVSPESEVMMDEQELDSLEAEMNTLAQSMFAVETYGINPTAVHIMRTTGLLEGTSIASLGLEAFGYEAPDHPDSQMALEALGEKMKEKAAQWSAKIVSMASSFGTKVMGVLNPIWEKITASVTTLSSAAWDKAKAAGKVVKAHPYKTIIGVILAVAAAAGVVLYGAQAMPAITAKQAQVTKYVTDMVSSINKIKNPFGSVSAKVAEGGAKFVVTIKNGASVAKGVAMDKLDWTASMVKSCGTQLGRAWSITKKGVTDFGTRAQKVGQSVKSGAKFASDAAGASSLIVSAKVAKASGSVKAGVAAGALWGTAVVQGIISTVVGLAKLAYGVIVAGLRTIQATFNALISGTAAAAA